MDHLLYTGLCADTGENEKEELKNSCVHYEFSPFLSKPHLGTYRNYKLKSSFERWVLLALSSQHMVLYCIAK
jgi:hypothetical protein